MLPEAAIERYTLARAPRRRPRCRSTWRSRPISASCRSSTRVERVAIAANLRHDALESVVQRGGARSGHGGAPFGAELSTLWRLARALAAARGRGRRGTEARPEYSFYVENDRVRIVRRLRGTPIDRIVSELMIHVNGALGARARRSAARRRSTACRRAARCSMSTVPAAHEGLGVEGYAWASSPLRRYVDLVNQRQLIALARGERRRTARATRRCSPRCAISRRPTRPTASSSATMERYWCLRWLIAGGRRRRSPATVMRESLVRFDDLPLVVRVPSLPALEPGSRVELGDFAHRPAGAHAALRVRRAAGRQLAPTGS